MFGKQKVSDELHPDDGRPVRRGLDDKTRRPNEQEAWRQDRRRLQREEDKVQGGRSDGTR